MFHLLVKGNGWAQGRDTLALDRVFEYTDATIAQQFKPGAGSLDHNNVILLPALFVTESFGSSQQQAHVGTIFDIRINKGEVVLEYSYDIDFPPISNAELAKLSKELLIDPFEFHRTHWAIKNVDLFKVLLRRRLGGTPVPKVFKIDESETVETDLISVMMSFDNRFDSVYAALQRIAISLKLNCLRANDIWKNDAIIQDVVSLINRSRIVVCDCTGRNANVFYEIGIAHTLGRDVILITQSENDIPFDLRHLRYIHYLNNGEGLQQLSDSVIQRIQTLIK